MILQDQPRPIGAASQSAVVWQLHEPMRPKWAFQLLPQTPDVLGKGYRVDPDTQALEDEVNAVLQCKFGFHGISKLVVRLGPKDGVQDYHESHGVAQRYYPAFDVYSYAALSPDQKRNVMRGIVLEVFAWLTTHFEDAQCFDRALAKLGWSSVTTEQ